MKNSILITGATGFIGKHLVKKIPNYNSAVDHNGKNIEFMPLHKNMEKEFCITWNGGHYEPMKID